MKNFMKIYQKTHSVNVIFYYHESCYEEWIQYKKENKCLICDKDISSNFYIPQEEKHVNN